MEGMMHEEAVLKLTSYSVTFLLVEKFDLQINQLFCDFLISGLEI